MNNKKEDFKFISIEDARKMSSEEVSANISNIVWSMQFWDERKDNNEACRCSKQ